jgi:hypothetical protein
MNYCMLAHSSYKGSCHKINDEDHLEDILNAYCIDSLSFFENPENISDNINYAQVFEILKTDQSVTNIHFNSGSVNNDYDYTTWYKLLCNTLKFNNTINSLTITSKNDKNWFYIDQLLKINNNIKRITMNCFSINRYSSSCMKSALQNNGTLLKLQFNIRTICEEFFRCLSEIISTNNTLRSLNLIIDYVPDLKHWGYIINAMEYNYSIIDIHSGYYDKPDKLRNYLARNKHNIRLKTMMLQDL